MRRKGGVACLSLLVWQLDPLWSLMADTGGASPERLIDVF